MLGTLAALAVMTKVQPPAPFGAVPSPRQLAWHQMEYYAFVHFGPNTFTGNEWGHGDEDPNLFNPTGLDTDQWCRTFREAGMKGVIITAKHHDGFCLWPSKQSTHTVAQSKWMDGKGDVLKSLSASAKKFGLKFGVYVSPWDRNHPAYGTDRYNTVFVKTLTEVLSNYGPVFEMWFDGANGEGPNGKKQVYDFPWFHRTVRTLQPDAVMFSDAGPDIRWVGNEGGFSAPTCWATIDRDRYVPGTPHYAELTEGKPNGTHWLPAECDVSIRKGWFWREAENSTVKTPEQLLDLYLRSVGQNGSFLLNVPPDTRGLVHENDVKALLGFKGLREKLFALRVSDEADYRSTAVRGGMAAFSAVQARDDNLATYWATDDQVTTGAIELDWKRPIDCDTLVLQEAYQLGQRVTGFLVEAKREGGWQEVAKGTTIGVKRILHFPRTKTVAIRVTITSSLACPTLAKVHVYNSEL